MRVPRHHSGEASDRRVNVKLGNLVQYVEQEFPNLDHLCDWKIRCPRPPIVIASDHESRSDLMQLLDHLGIADVPGVDEKLGPLESPDSLRSNQTVCIPR